MNHIAGYIEGALLILFGISAGCFALFGNYEFLMNQKFMWLTAAGSILVCIMGFVILFAPRTRAGGSGIGAFILLALAVAIAQPYAYDVNSLVVPGIRGEEGVPLMIGDTRYTFVSLDKMNRSIVPGDEEFEDRRIVMTGLYKQTPELEAQDQFALVRPLSVCCAADALLVGIRAEDKADTTLADQWVNVYGTIRRLDAPLPKPKIRHGAIRYASISEVFVLETDMVTPYIRARPKEDIMKKLEGGNFGIFADLAKRAGLPEMLEEQEMVTVLAPVDEAFDALPPGFIEELLEKQNRERLKAFVGNHVLLGELSESDLRVLTSAKTITGDTITIRKVNGRLRAGDSRFLFKNIVAEDGLIHAIYPVLVPDADIKNK
jgi:uncharacterized surface protein with fasciclin (FAS1) repeats